MSYALEHLGEAQRLEDQAKQVTYDIKKEFRYLNVKTNELILDAGCGTGLVSRFLYSLGAKMEACDQSEIRLQQAKQLADQHQTQINFFQSNLESKIAAEGGKYDKVASRFVIEHLINPQNAINEMYRVLKPQGEIYIIDLDGILFNFHTLNTELNSYLEKLKPALPVDLFIGRKLPTLLASAGFKKIKWDIDIMNFYGDELKLEKENYRERFEFSFPALAGVLGNQAAQRFVGMYLDELDNPTNTLFYNKFMVRGIK